MNRIACVALSFLASGCAGNASPTLDQPLASTTTTESTAPVGPASSSSAPALPSASSSASTKPSICPTKDDCAHAAKDRLDALESHENDASARPFLARACELGHGESCLRLANLTATRFFGAPDRASAITILSKSCADTPAIETCAALSRLSREAGDERWVAQAQKTCGLEGITPPRLVECAFASLNTGGVAALEATCKDDAAQDVVACDVLFEALAPGQKTADATKRAKLERDVTKRATSLCKGPPYQCDAMATLITDKVVPADADALEAACGWGSSKSCVLWIDTLAAAKKYEQAASAAADPCRADNARACATVARMAAQKKIESPTLPQALYLAERACLLDDRTCDAVADVTDAMVDAKTPTGTATPEDALARACKAGNVAACNRKPRKP